ncbi:hypothetical protein KP509_25G041900 [Ceratopteris richardii]|uniref:Uncharacterized protein n=1 Tax=Ceratopteris richardii TaxID=49495 RepID=A0A8T2RPJ2_CERRI|nr:hypothetical protein KP509_25G041900 [Ceratopteris richardii]
MHRSVPRLLSVHENHVKKYETRDCDINVLVRATVASISSSALHSALRWKLSIFVKMLNIELKIYIVEEGSHQNLADCSYNSSNKQSIFAGFNSQ